MNDEQDYRRKRDSALKAWRGEVERLENLIKSADVAPQELKSRKKAITKARNLYDSLNDQYLNHIESRKMTEQKPVM